MVADTSITNALRGVIDPELGDNVVDLGMVQGFDWLDDGRLEVRISLTTAGCPLRAQLLKDVRTRVGGVPGVGGPDRVKVTFGEMTSEQKRSLMDRARWKASERESVNIDIPPTARVVAIASGKGGVGKSSVTVNLAVALAARGMTIGVLDADIGGFSIPRMLGLAGRVDAAKDEGGRLRITPLEKRVAPDGLLKVVSMGSIEGAEEDQAIMLRGLMLNRALQHFLEDVRWGALDYLLLDMPPGTSDVQMGLARMLPRTEMLIVTTPAVAAQKVAARAADMARKGHLRVAGVIENMSAFTCDHGQSYALFGAGGGERLAVEIGVPLLGSIPLHPSVASGGDAGEPAALAGSGPVGDAVAAIAERVVNEAIPLVEMSGCSARLFDVVQSNLGPAPAATP
ncbi:MAG: Mrp/NBP35 family ATP-binding protein [Actinobacteria bacterium]|nr:Mrp/NBP35 family ATP-binding protein [Actinomycetota bacterium]MBW3649628.1 Mrp/NBP35 family ATP-binding protein [Actinomycetota bacterium]